MTFDLRLTDSWEDQNRFIRGLLGILEPNTQVGLYHGAGHALLDLLYGLKEFWPVKKNLVVICDGDPYLLSCLRTFVREGYAIQKVLSHEIGNVQTWVNNLKSETLAVIYSADHAFTGELLLPEDLAEKLSLRKIYSIEIQHSLHAYSKRSLFPWTVQLQHYFPDLAIVLQGARVRMFQHSAHLLDWTHRNIEEDLRKWRSQNIENKEIVKKFEKEIIQHPELNITPYFDFKKEERLWDRTILRIPTVGGEYFIHKLAQILSIKLDIPGFESQLETTHLCRWKAFEEYEWWGQGIKNGNEFKSLVTIAASVLQKKHFFEIFSGVVSTCQKDTQLI